VGDARGSSIGEETAWRANIRTKCTRRSYLDSRDSRLKLGRTTDVCYMEGDTSAGGTPITAIEKINLAQKFALIEDHWNPRIAGELNDSHVKLVKLKGEFVWHHHEVEDELFLVIKGRLTIRLRDGDLELEPGEMVIIPHGVEHQPVANEEVEVLLLEPASTLNTGNVQGDRTVETLGRI
jgi:mannose-6-phosphate isomerase-like protein (cupin superfamily)